MRRTAVIIMSMLAIVCVLAGCSQKSSTSDNELYKGKTVFGVVSKVGSDSLTINVGAGIGMPGSEGGEGTDQAENEAVIEVDKDTEITKSQMGPFGNGGAPDGQPPEGWSPEDGFPEGERPEKPEGGWPEGEKPEKPEDMPEKPEGGWPEGEKPEDGEKPEGMPDFKGEAIKLSDISEGDIVSVTLDENGKTVSISVMGGSDGQVSQGEPPEMPEGQENGSV